MFYLLVDFSQILLRTDCKFGCHVFSNYSVMVKYSLTFNTNHNLNKKISLTSDSFVVGTLSGADFQKKW